MKVLLINGSPKARGCTHSALAVVKEQLEQAGLQTEMIHVGHKPIHGCIACMKCKATGKCVFNDAVNEVAAKLEVADGVVVGTPVYFSGMTGTLKCFLDRLFFSVGFDKSMKVGAAVASSRRSGSVFTIDSINHYFNHGEMPVASSRYWNEIHGNAPEELLQDQEGLQILRVLGRNMAFLVKSIQLGKTQYGLPQKESRIATNFVRQI